MDNNEEKSCGNCCWFCFEDAYGDGQCVEVGDDGYPMMATMCNCHACKRFVSRQEMRHHMAVLLQMSRYEKDPLKHLSPWYEEKDRAIKFAYRYIKVFGKL